MNKNGALRVSTAMGYLDPARHRANLVIRPNTLVRRVVFEGKRVGALEIEADGRVETFALSSLSCSPRAAIHTPSILVRSGNRTARQSGILGHPPCRSGACGRARLLDHPGTLPRAGPPRGSSSPPDRPPFIHPRGSPRRPTMAFPSCR